jgi:hypothetical protein
MQTQMVPPALSCLLLIAASMATGCVAPASRREIYLVPLPPAPVQQSAPRPLPTHGVLRLNNAYLPIVSPASRPLPGAVRSLAMAAASVAQTDPGAAVHLYRRLIKQHGNAYESAFTRDAYHDALRCAWQAGDFVLLRSVLQEHDQSLADFERTPVPKFVKRVRGFLRATEDDLESAYAELNVRRLPVAYGILKRDRAQWLGRHRDTVISLVTMVRDHGPAQWSMGLLDQLVLAEATFLNGYVSADCEILLFKDADARARRSGDAGNSELIAAVAQVFLERSGVVPAPDNQRYLLGREYERR